jgi:hypothetical protein
MTLQLHDITPKASFNYGNEMSLKRKVIPDITAAAQTHSVSDYCHAPLDMTTIPGLTLQNYKLKLLLRMCNNTSDTGEICYKDYY